MNTIKKQKTYSFWLKYGHQNDSLYNMPINTNKLVQTKHRSMIEATKRRKLET